MASRAISRGRKYLLDPVNNILAHSSFTLQLERKIEPRIAQSGSTTKKKVQGLASGFLRLPAPGHAASLSSRRIGKNDVGLPLGARCMLQPLRLSSTSAGQPKDKNEQIDNQPFLRKFWGRLLGIGPALRAHASTFEDKRKEEEALKRKLLNDSSKEMTKEVQASYSGDIKQTPEDLSDFLKKVRKGTCVPYDEIMRFARLCTDELTLDNMSRPPLVNMCKYMGIRPFGTDNHLRMILCRKMMHIKNADKIIQAEGVESLSEEELRQACRERGVLGLLSTEEMQQQLREWLDLSLNHSVPSSVLILSRAFAVSGKVKPEEIVVSTLSSLLDEVVDTVGTVLISDRKHEKEEKAHNGKSFGQWSLIAGFVLLLSSLLAPNPKSKKDTENETLDMEVIMKHLDLEGLEKAGVDISCYRFDKLQEYINNEDDIPDQVNWCQAGAIKRVKDQEQLGICTMCAVLSAAEAIYWIKTNKDYHLSLQHVIDCSNGDCVEGSKPHTILQFITKEGCLMEEEYPYTGIKGPCRDKEHPIALRINGYVSMPATEEGLMRAVALQPVVGTVYVNDEFENFRGGKTLEISDCPAEGDAPDPSRFHAVVVVAYGEDKDGKFWLILNSWGTSWGDKGYAKLRRGVLDGNGRGVAGLTSEDGWRSCYVPIID